MNGQPDWSDLDRKLVAILRGLPPGDAEAVVTGLIRAGFRAIEVPLNSPEPFKSIEIALALAEELAPGECLIGAGTVLNPDDAERVAGIGGGLVVSPNTDREVILAARAAGLVAMPGVFTPTEALQAVAAGASVLKFFPAYLLGPGGIRAIAAVLPPDTPFCAVGGVDMADIGGYYAVAGVGLGSSLYKPGDAPSDVADRARKAVAAFDAARRKAQGVPA